MRFIPLVATTLLAAGGLLAVPQTAGAAPSGNVTVGSSATGPRAGTSTTADITVTVTVTDHQVGLVRLRSGVPGHVDADSVRVDGDDAPAGTADTTQQGDTSNLTVRAGTGASALSGGLFGVGKHTITFSTDLTDLAGTGSTPADVPQVTSSVEYVDGIGASTSSVESDTTIPLPDVTVTKPAVFDQPTVLQVAEGGQTLLFAEVGHKGATVAGSTLTLTLPRGLDADPHDSVVRFTAADDDDPTPLTCTRATSAELRCDLGRLRSATYVGVALHATAAVAPGTTGTVRLSARAANGLDADPTDNSLDSTVRFVAAPRLRTHVSTDRTRVELGAKAHIAVTVTNEGDDPVDVIAPIFVENEDLDQDDDSFEVTHFSGKEGLPGLDGGSDPGAAAAAMVGTKSTTPLRTAMAQQKKAVSAHDSGSDDSDSDSDDSDSGSDDVGIVFWNAGTIAPGATVHSVVTVEAKHAGPADAVALAVASTGISSCLADRAGDDDVPNCPEADGVELRAVAAAAGHGSKGDGTLAATGVPTGQLTGLGLALFVLGGLSLYAGSRRSRVIGRHRDLV